MSASAKKEKQMRKKEGIGQCVLEYKHGGRDLNCGMTYFQCGVVPIVILTDLDDRVSLTNSFESAAAAAYKQFFLHVEFADIIFIEHYNRKTPEVDSYFRVEMKWAPMLESYSAPSFGQIDRRTLEHLLSCYGHSRSDIPQMTFASAQVYQFPVR